MSWTPEELSLEDSDKNQRPVLLRRTDGVPLIYRGRTHAIVGESESGKTWLALHLIGEFFTHVAGSRVLYMDFDQDKSTIIKRLTELDVDPKQIAKRMAYVSPQAAPETVDDQFLRIMTMGYRTALVIIDNVQAAIAAMGYGAGNEAAARWEVDVPNKLASHDLSVVMLDHVTKSHDGSGRFAIGPSTKLNAISGAQFVMNVVAPPKPGAVGEVELRVAKDRSGYVRAESVDFRQYDRTERTAWVIIDGSDPEHVEVRLDPPQGRSDVDGKLLKYLEDNGESNLRALRQHVSSNKDTLSAAIDRLLANGEITERPGPNRQRLFRVE